MLVSDGMASRPPTEFACHGEECLLTSHTHTHRTDQHPSPQMRPRSSLVLIVQQCLAGTSELPPHCAAHEAFAEARVSRTSEQPSRREDLQISVVVVARVLVVHPWSTAEGLQRWAAWWP